MLFINYLSSLLVFVRVLNVTLFHHSRNRQEKNFLKVQTTSRVIVRVSWWWPPLLWLKLRDFIDDFIKHIITHGFKWDSRVTFDDEVRLRRFRKDATMFRGVMPHRDLVRSLGTKVAPGKRKLCLILLFHGDRSRSCYFFLDRSGHADDVIWIATRLLGPDQLRVWLVHDGTKCKRPWHQRIRQVKARKVNLVTNKLVGML
jgi:hypothetical protein